VTTTTTTPDPRGAALSLIIQAASILEPFRDEDGEEDHRLGLLHAISEAWDHSCELDTWESIMPRQLKRWNVARELLEYDNAPGIRRRIRRRLVQIADQTADLVSSSNDNWPLQRDQQLARELREAIDDLANVVRAITAVHLLEETAS
jgi:hypothetical protein